MKLLILFILLLDGCAAMPDSVNYTISIDHQTGDTTSYVGGSWNVNKKN